MVRIIVFFAALVYGALLFFSLPKVVFNNDYWLPKHNDINTIGLFRIGISAWIWIDGCFVKFNHSYFQMIMLRCFDH